MTVIEHHIQRDIIDRLMHAGGLRFSALKPEGMESNIFMYHLKQLIKDKLVQKEGTQYRLAPAGLTYADGLSSANLRPRPQPKLIAILAVQNLSGNWLLAERKIQPYIGQLMLPSGKQHRGESPSEHATRELQEKTGLITPLAFCGTADIQVMAASGELLTHAVGFMYSGKVDNDALPPETDRLRYTWSNQQIAHELYMPGTEQLLNATSVGGTPFFLELKLTANSPLPVVA